MTSGQSRLTPSPGTMPKSKCGLSWNTVSGVARMMSVSSAYSECSSTGPFKAEIIGDSMSRMFDSTLRPSRRILSYPCGLKKSRSEEHTSELQSRLHLVCRLLLEKKKNIDKKRQILLQ